ncbi:ribonuclease P protein component [Pseudobacter ginsenosidimutans]|uniref:Ribonuclease P protein component n=1 Tax=Pseudobacter ginsenosidimutans TaxID=661488 RepID=A0A4V2F116_9BACT|nr:ribonuclease P protein component [Pseudobacter ginsenosidimutans]QEC41173.1 ribonuclease P protein component [Pseudobacter ginsenosidimutans]RZS72061.1 ribonuclease P protein component [Pseudobacter ginsenosidimutans]
MKDPKNTLGKTERLKRRKAIEQLFKKGKHFSVFPLRVSYAFIPYIETSLQAGFSVSSRHFGKSTDRNRIKRLMREAYRLQKQQLQEATVPGNVKLALFFVYVGKDVPDYNVVSEKIGVILQRLTGIVNEANPQNT